MSREAAARVRHDLGKYVVFEVAWLPEHPSPEALRAALEQDLRRTRRDASGSLTAPELWRSLHAGLGAAALEPEAREVDRLVAELEPLLSCLDAPRPDPAALHALASLAEQIRRTCYAWWERTRGS